MGLKNAKITSTVGEAVDTAFGIFQELSDELHEWATGIEERQGQTDFYETVNGVADELEQWDKPNIPESVSNTPVEYTNDTRTQLTKAQRRDNATAALDAAITALKEDPQEEDETINGAEEDSSSDVDELIETLEQIKDEVESLDFPRVGG